MSVPEKSFEPGAACPLDGVRVIDMSRLVSGNMVSLQLADFGAEVLKIEDPKTRRPAARLADQRRQRALEGLFAKQEERGVEPARGTRARAVPRPDRDFASTDREFPPGDARSDGPRAGNPAPA